MSTEQYDFVPFSLRHGLTQGEKTQQMLSDMSVMIHQRNIIVLVDNKNDQQQQMMSRLQKHKTNGNLPAETTILSDALTSKKITAQFKKMFRDNQNHQILVLKFNSAQIEKLTDAIILGKEENLSSTIAFQILVDEGDIATKHENTIEVVEGQPKVHASFIHLRNKCEQKQISCAIQFISATPQNVLVNYPVERIDTHRPSANYRGYRDVEFVCLPVSKTVDAVTHLTPGIIQEMHRNGEKGNILICTNRKKADHEKLVRIVKQWNIMTMTYNGDGIVLFVPMQYLSAFQHERDTYRSDIATMSFSQIDAQTFLSKDAFIGDVYQIINNMGVMVCVTIGKDLMSRGMSFCSVSREDSIPLATTRMIVDVANTTHCVGLIQMIGRLLGTVCPFYKRVLYCQQKVYDDYIHANQDLEENIKKYQRLLQTGQIQYTNEIGRYTITERSREEDRTNANVKTVIIRKQRKTDSESSDSPFSQVSIEKFKKFERMFQNHTSVLLPLVRYMYESYNSPDDSYVTLDELSQVHRGSPTALRNNLLRMGKSGSDFWICNRNNNRFKLRDVVYQYIRNKNLFS